MSARPRQSGSDEPFVGPQAFTSADAWRFFGREREVADLADIVAASRIVLLYSPSGAGKSSLINAALIPRFRERFRVLPVISVGGVPAPSPDGVPVNRYLRSALLSLENGLPKGATRMPASELAGMTFASYLARRREMDGDDRPELLVFDQFEEILSIDPIDLDAKTAFFGQVGEALRDRQRWALFSMREEYDARLDPYRRLVPTGLTTRFRLDLLGTDAAIQAIWRPTRNLPVKITVGAAEAIVGDLSRVQIEQDGEPVTRQGPYVDPVQLQVVCLRLWEKRTPGTTEITADDIERTGTNVDVALGEYYAETVADASEATGVPERAIRSWIGEHLITRHGIRNRVLREPGESRGMGDRVIDFLIGRYLLRTVPGDATWVELAHDRLVPPVQQSNDAWFIDKLSPLQRHAEAWERGGRSRDLLLPARLLKEAGAWAHEHSEQVAPAERELLREFLTASQAAHDAARARQLWMLLPTGAVLILILSALTIWALRERELKQAEANVKATAEVLADVRANEAEANASAAAEARETADAARATAEAQADLSRTEALAAQAPDQHDAGDDERGALLALQAFALQREGDPATRALVDDALRVVLGRRHFSVILDNAESVLAVAFSPDGRTLATASAVGEHGGPAPTIRLWNLADPAAGAKIVRGPDGRATVLAFSPDGATLAVGGSHTIRLLDAASGQPRGEPLETAGTVNALSFSPDGTLVAAVVSAPLRAASNIQMWDVAAGERRWDPVAIGGADTVIAFAPDGAALAASTGAEVRFVDTTTGEVRAETLPTEAGVTALAFSPDGRKFAVASGPSGAVRLWTSDDEAPEPFDLHGQASSVVALAFSHDSQTLAAGHSDGSVRLWSPARPEADPVVLRGHAGSVRTVAFSADDGRLATGSEDGKARVWSLGPALAEPGMVQAPEPGEGSTVAGAVVVSTDGPLRLATLDQSGTLQQHNPADAWLVAQGSRGRGGGMTALAISADGTRLATGGRDGTVQLWMPEGRSAAGVAVPPGFRGSVSALAFSPDGTRLAIGGTDGTIRVRLLNGEGSDVVLRGPRVAVAALAFSPDGALFSAGADGTVLIWDPARPDAEPRRMPASGSSIASLAIASDGGTLATGGLDGTIRLWLVDQPAAPPIVLRGMTGTVTAMAFSPDGAILFTVHADGSVRSWIARTDILAGMVCDQVRRNLTADEWDLFVGSRVAYQRTCDNLPPGEGAPGAGTPVAIRAGTAST